MSDALELGPLTWNAVHSARLIARDNGTLELSDTETYDWCLIRATDPRFDGARIRLAVEVRFIDPTAQFYVNHWGGIDICAIDAAGRTMFASGDVEIGASRRDRDTVSIVVEFFNGHETLSFGACRGSPGQYAGSGQRLIEFVSINVGIVILSCPEEDRIVLADVGAMDGLQREWLAQGRRVRPVLFEPNPESARGLRERIAHLPGGLVIESALSNRRSRRTLHVTRHAGCTSLLRPNAELLKRYKLAPMFDVIKELEVKCVRYDELHAAGKVPAPDVIKIDVQGAEYEVLEGFGGLLQTCLGVELEAHLYRIYQGQKLMHELIDLLDRFDLTLREIREQRNFDGDAVEFNAFFTRREESLRADSSIDKRKLGRIEAVWRLTTSDWGARMAAGLSD